MSAPESEPTSGRPPYRPSSRERLIWGILVLFILGLTGAALVHRLKSPAREPLPVITQLPHFTLTNRDGRTVTLGDFAGTPWVADFIFTRCPGICPFMSQRMSRLATELPASGAVKLVSFSVDPDYDTPEVLQEYAERHHAPDHWFFLTGESEKIRSLSRDGFLLAVAESTEEDQAAASDVGESIEPIVHSNRFVLVDGAGRVRGYYDAFDEKEVAKLLGDVRTLLDER